MKNEGDGQAFLMIHLRSNGSKKEQEGPDALAYTEGKFFERVRKNLPGLILNGQPPWKLWEAWTPPRCGR